MAKLNPITPGSRPEAPARPIPNTLMHRFSALLAVLAIFVEAARDLQHFDHRTADVVHWLHDAEEAFTRVATQIARIGRMIPACPSAHWLQRIATRINMMIGTGPVPKRIAALLGTARQRISALVTLACFIDLLTGGALVPLVA